MGGVSQGLLCTGTTGNEALHAELRGCLRQVYRVHLPTLQLRLDTLALAKRVSWDAALRIPGLVQRSQHALLCRVLARPLVDPAAWEPTAREGPSGARRKASLPFSTQRQCHVAHVRRWVRMTPHTRYRVVKKKTVFSSRRITHLSGGGACWGKRAKRAAV